MSEQTKVSVIATLAALATIAMGVVDTGREPLSARENLQRCAVTKGALCPVAEPTAMPVIAELGAMKVVATRDPDLRVAHSANAEDNT
jgi:hypothetical protein